MKKFGKTLLALVAALAVSIAGFAGVSSAMADAGTGPFTITIDTSEKAQGHKFAAYQIFKGDLDVTVEGSKDVTTLSNIQWGNGITENGKTALYKAYNATGNTIEEIPEGFDVGSNAVAAEVAEAIAKKGLDTLAAQDLAKIIGTNLEGTGISAETDEGKTTITVQDAGYYLIKDMTEFEKESDDSVVDKVAGNAASGFILEVVKNVNVTPKVDIPTVDKKVQSSDAELAGDSDWATTADHAIGEIFQFKVTGTLPADEGRGSYDRYQVKFTDTMSGGISFKGETKVSLNYGENSTITLTNTDEKTYYTVNSAPEFDQSDKDTVKTILTVDIPDLIATLPQDVKITDEITIVVTYDACLNANAQVNGTDDLKTSNENSVYLEYSNNPSVEGLGKTTTDETYVFTWKVPMLKVDGEDYDEAENNKTSPDIAKLPGAQFTLKKGGASNPISFVAVPGGGYRVATSDEITGDLNKQDDEKITTTTITSNDKGIFDVSGLDSGTYTLTETKAPSGYNIGGPWTITVSSERTMTGEGTEAKETPDELRHTIAQKLQSEADSKPTDIVTIANYKGSQLPSTGGMGTTILYIVGGVVVLAAIAGLVIVMRRRQQGR